MNKTPIILKPGDTKIEDIIYGIDIEVIVHGKVHQRHFEEKFCECDNQIKAWHYWTEHGYKIVYNFAFKKRRFCSVKCVTKNRMEVRRGLKQSKPKKIKALLSPVRSLPIINKNDATMAWLIRSL